MGRREKNVTRTRVTNDSIKAGEQQTLDKFVKKQRIEPVSSTLERNDPSPPPPSAVIHEVIDNDEEFIEKFPYGNLSSENIQASKRTVRELIRLHFKRFSNFKMNDDLPMAKKVKRKRNYYDKEQRESITELFFKLPGNDSEKLEGIHSISGYEKIRRSNITNWARNLQRKGGRKICREFEEQVASELILFNVNGGESGFTSGNDLQNILANIIYSYDCVRRAAQTIYVCQPKWQEHEDVKGKKFSNRWVQGFLQRLKLRKRVVTTVIKVRPSSESIREQMNGIRDFILHEGINPDCVFNADETGINWAPKLKHQYVPKSALRAVTPGGDETGRFTAMLGSNCNGQMLPISFLLNVLARVHMISQHQQF